MIWDGRIRADARNLPIADESVQCVVTSPPYFGLRDYGHPGQIGLEKTPAAFVDVMLSVFAEVWRVLKSDGTLWLNLGDSYAGSWGSQGRQGHADMTNRSIMSARQIAASARKISGTGSVSSFGCIKAKDLIGIPWRVAFALQEAGWYLRSDIIWAKNNPMPESVTDRPTKAHEYLFLLTKSERYYYDCDAIKEPSNPEAGRDTSSSRRMPAPGKGPDTGFRNGRRFETRNKRSVWSVSTSPYPEAHYATFPPALIEPCILAGSRPGDVVLDPFAGSGTVAMVSEQHGRRWLAVDLGFQDLQAKRLSQLQKVFA